jgi:NAD(P)H-quinone oxidoreductase subunit 2
MMVVKEPEEMSEAVKNYPATNWSLPGMRPLQVGVVFALVTTSLAGILSNPLFTLANNSVLLTPMLQPTITTIQPAPTPATPGYAVEPEVEEAIEG